MDGLQEGWDDCQVCGKETIFRRHGIDPWFCTICGTRDPENTFRAVRSFDSLALGVPAPDPFPPRPRKARAFFIAPVLAVAVLGAVAGWLVMNRATGPNVPGVGAGVHVCTVSHYVESGVYCQQADPIVSLDDGYVSFTGPHGNNFPATTLQFVLRKANADGTEQTVGQTRSTVSLATNIMAMDLKSLFSNFNVTPTQGASFGLEVDSQAMICSL